MSTNPPTDPASPPSRAATSSARSGGHGSDGLSRESTASGRPTDAGPAQPTDSGPAATTRRRGRGNWRSLLLSLLVVLAVVVGWLSLTPRTARIERPAVDVTAFAAYVHSSTGTRVLLPSIEEPWRPTSVRATNEGGLPGWHAGWTQPDDETAYIGIEQATSRDQAADDAWLVTQVRGTQTGTTDIAGRQWRVYSSDTDPVRTSLVGAVGGMVVVVDGLTDPQTLAQVAASLRPYEPTNPAASPSS